jgi:UDP-N-acetylmuramoyl-L-alanyl-D-glutamate--2,6-diaminopimelate ligase
VARGAAAVAVETAVDVPVPSIIVRDGRLAAIALARAWHDDPAAGMQLVGVTGTNGKTTTTGLIRHLLNRDGQAGAIGTLGAFDGAGDPVPSEAGSLTTPGPLGLHATFAALRDRGVTRVAMETSSHSLDQGRLDGLLFAAAVFTNLTLEHLDYHETMERYLAAKLRLLGLLSRDAVVAVNADDPAWRVIPAGPGRIRFGFAPDADLRAALPALAAAGSRFRVEGRFGVREASLPLPGEFNIANALGALAVALGLGQSLAEAVERLAGAPQVTGRMERLGGSAFTVLRDYAHTPDALERALATVRRVTPGRLLLVFGCGGDRDRGKRPLMGRLAGEAADCTFLTSDNPRSEDPDAIIAEIAAGLPPGAPHHRILDRREAIGAALAAARPGDTVLLAGKGHETYQIVGTVKHPFDERRIVAELLAEGTSPDGRALD